MSLTQFHTRVEDRVLIITWDMPDRSMNVITEQVMDEMEQLIDLVSNDSEIDGAVIQSGKSHFSGGADLKMLSGLLHDLEAEAQKRGRDAAVQMLFDRAFRLSKIYRRLETSGKPWVATIKGTCMGGAFELALACHGRVVADTESTRLGLPEVKVGLFPGAGGTQRVMRMTDPQSGLTMLLKGQSLSPAKARGMKLIEAVVPADDLVSTAKTMIQDGLDARKPWDKDGFKLPGGKIHSPAGYQFWPAANAIYRKETYDNYPGARGIMTSVYEGLHLPMDLALRVEARYFTHVLQTPEAAAMIRSLFVNMQALGKGARRPADVPDTGLARIGIIGAGFMGAGIAYVSAVAGLNVVLIDRNQAAVDKGKATVDSLASDGVKKGRMKPDAKADLLDRIQATESYEALADCQLVIEAVFEDRAVKAEVIENTARHLAEHAIFASNTSTLPITSLATSFPRANDFIGIHFFSPVHKMMLVEIIMGKETGDRALATAMDFVRMIRKTPIVVNDTRGFFANRCVLNYIREAHLMVTEGIPPAMVENAARMAGMPVGPLSLNDETALDLGWRILQAAKKDLGADAINPAQEKLLEEMVIKQERYGRKNGKGFYDYPEGRGKKRLWPGLKDLVPVHLDPDTIDVEELKQRILVTQSLEAARCVEERVITDVREADVGSILGFGFAPFTGGALSYIDGMGTTAFVDLCDRLTSKFGDRFAVPALLREMVATNETFHGRFPPDTKAAA